MAFIEIAEVSKSFGAFRALSDVDLAFDAREFITFLGPSGCGKTTMLRTLAGFIRPDRGTIKVAERVLSGPRAMVPIEQRHMGMVFQNYAVWPHLSVFENVAFGLRIKKLAGPEISKRVTRILAAVGLEGLAQRHPGQLSGGQQQRVALARSIVVEPSILLLDEPLSNLDAKLRERMRTELKALQRRTGITFIYVTHDQAEAMALSDRIVVFNNGRVQQVGTPRDIYERPANVFVADFMGLVNKVDGEIIACSAALVEVRIGSTTIMARRSHGLVQQSGAVIVAIRPEAIRLGAAGRAENSLRGRLHDSTFLGNVVDYQVDVDGILIRAQGDRAMQVKSGDLMELAVPVADCVAMQKDGE